MYEILAPIAKLLGWILDILFKGMNTLGVGNVALAIVIFTLIVKLLMLPLTIQQQKMAKIQQVLSPEIKAIQEKYKGKNSDTAAMQMMQVETKAVYEKYGVNQWGSCVQLLIQMPILLALYRVFQRIPLYITTIKVLFLNIIDGTDGVNGISSVDGYTDTLNNIYGKTVDWTNVDTAVTTLNSFTTDQWNQLKDQMPQCADLITQNIDKITHMNTFLGINMSQNPGFGLNIAVLIPIIAGLSQFLSVKVSQAGMVQDDDNPAAASMKMMTYVMPLMSAFIAISVPAGLGVYWIATALIQTVMYVCINKYYDNKGLDKIIEDSVKKREKKLAKKGVPTDSISKAATINTKNVSTAERLQKIQEKQKANEERIKELKENANNYKTSKSGSLADKANMVSRYNEMNGDKKKK